MRSAIASCFDNKNRSKYPDKPYRITEMTDAERDIENKNKVERMREMLIEHKRRWDDNHNRS